jgi:hypothetical protein
MMIQRIPEDKAPAPLRDPYDGSKTLAETLDKGFPYDDADNSPDDQVANWKNKKINPATLVGNLEYLLPKSSKIRKVIHHRSLPYENLPSFICELKKVDLNSACALLFLILTSKNNIKMFSNAN